MPNQDPNKNYILYLVIMPLKYKKDILITKKKSKKDIILGTK